jgi:hypothetical protein
VDPAEALLLEGLVAHAQDLVDEQHLRLEVRGDREGEPHVHAARVALHRDVDEALDLRELDDLVVLPCDVRAPHAEDGAVQVDVVPAAQLGVEPRPDLEQRADAPVHDRLALGRLGDPGEDLQQRRLPGSVPPDDAEDLPLVDLEREVAKGPEVLPRPASPRRPHRLGGLLHQRPRARPPRDHVPLAETLDRDGWHAHAGHATSASARSRRTK